MTECSACGAELAAHQVRCPICGKPTVYYHRQRRCLHCGMPAAQTAKTCMMCGQPVDSLPLQKSLFSGSWWGISLGVLIVIGLVVGLFRYQSGRAQEAQQVQAAAMPTTTLPAATATPSSTPTITDTPMPTATPTATATPTPRTHTVERGENPSFIAETYGVAVEDLIAINNIDDVAGLQVGQTLIIPPLGLAPADDTVNYAPTPVQTTYEVKGGDTLLGIALNHGTTVEAIVAANPDINTDLIFPGQNLVVPLATPTITPTPAPPATATATPGPLYEAPALLSPAAGQVIEADTLLFNWTVSGVLARDEFYVIQLIWADGSRTEHWVKNSSWRVSKTQRPAAGPVTWNVSIRRQTGAGPDGTPQGLTLVASTERAVEWP